MARDSQGNPVSTEMFVSASQVPAGVAQIVEPYVPEKLKLAVIGYNVKTENGRIVAVKPAFKSDKFQTNWITRQDAYNAQLKYNTESMKGPQPAFGNVQGQQQPFSANQPTKGTKTLAERMREAAKQK